MQQHSKLFALVLMLLVALGACKSNDPSSETDPNCENPIRDAKQVRETLVGTWKWVQTKYVQRTGTIIETPASSGKNIQLTFTAERVTWTESGVSLSYVYEVTSLSSGDMQIALKEGLAETARYNLFFCKSSMRMVDQNSSAAGEMLFNR